MRACQRMALPAFDAEALQSWTYAVIPAALSTTKLVVGGLHVGNVRSRRWATASYIREQGRLMQERKQ